LKAHKQKFVLGKI